jgi:hypothetical protein
VHEKRTPIPSHTPTLTLTPSTTLTPTPWRDSAGFWGGSDHSRPLRPPLSPPLVLPIVLFLCDVDCVCVIFVAVIRYDSCPLSDLLSSVAVLFFLSYPLYCQDLRVTVIAK